MICPVIPPGTRSLRETRPDRELLSFGRRPLLLRRLLRRLPFHCVGGSLHFIRRFLHLISEHFLFRLNISWFRLLILHLHLAVLHPWHAAVIHVLHALRTFRVARGLTQLGLNRDCCLIVREQVVRRPHWNADCCTGRITRWKRQWSYRRASRQ